MCKGCSTIDVAFIGLNVLLSLCKELRNCNFHYEKIIPCLNITINVGEITNEVLPYK